MANSNEAASNKNIEYLSFAVLFFLTTNFFHRISNIPLVIYSSTVVNLPDTFHLVGCEACHQQLPSDPVWCLHTDCTN